MDGKQDLTADKEKATGGSSTYEEPSHSSTKPPKRVVPKSLNMNKLGKGDLLRLLSILEGELEARDIYITSLQAQLNRDNYVKNNYFHHGISDPFLALMRDNEAISGTVTPHDGMHASMQLEKRFAAKIEPLPLLEKVVNKYKNQQDKVRQHMALSDAYYNLVNEELMEEKLKQATISKDEDHSADSCNAEKLDHLKTAFFLEKAKTKRIENEYKKLLQLVSKERQKYKLIITLLLEDRNSKNCDDQSDSESTSSVPLQERIQDLVLKNNQLEISLQEAKQNETKMLKQVEYLFQQAKILKLTRENDEKEKKEGDTVQLCIESEEKYETPTLPPKSTRLNSNRVSRSLDYNTDDVSLTTTISVKRTSSVIEKRTLHKSFGETQIVASSGSHVQDLTGDYVMEQQQPDVVVTPPPTIISSPTSGAANFALNSPNEPHPSTPFAIPPTGNLSAQQQTPYLTSHSNQFQATRQKFQRIAKETVVNETSKSNFEKENNLLEKRRNAPITEGENMLPSVSKSDKLMKTTEYRPQPPKPPKANQIRINQSATNHNHDGSVKLRPPPLPPKKPNLKQSSSKLPGVKVPQHEKEDSKKTGSLAGERQSRLSAPKVSTASKHLTTNKSGSVKRPTSLNSNNNNNRSLSKRYTGNGNESGSVIRGVHPVPPGVAASRLSAQQRLFQDGGDGELLSPVTNTVPKSPMGPGMFAFK